MIKSIITILLFSMTVISYSQDKPSIIREGFVFGTSLGVSATSIQFTDKTVEHVDLAMDLKIGYMLNYKLAVLLTSNVSIYDYSGFGRNRKRDFGVLAPSLQYWLNDRFWILGGIGVGGDNPVFWDIKNTETDPLETKYYSGLGIITSVGYEIYQSKNNFTLDVKARTMYRSVKLQEGNTSGFSFGLLLGFNLY